jgi:hypothetical protein
MALSSSSTLAQVQASYDDTASFEETDDVTMAKQHMTAIRLLLRREFKSTAGAGLSVVKNADILETELQRTHSWIIEHGVGEGSADILYFGQSRD